MAVGEGATEIPDSEDEPFTSSSRAIPQASVGKASRAAIGSHESLSGDRQQTALAFELSDLQSANLREADTNSNQPLVDSLPTSADQPGCLYSLGPAISCPPKHVKGKEAKVLEMQPAPSHGAEAVQQRLLSNECSGHEHLQTEKALQDGEPTTVPPHTPSLEISHQASGISRLSRSIEDGTEPAATHASAENDTKMYAPTPLHQPTPHSACRIGKTHVVETAASTLSDGAPVVNEEPDAIDPSLELHKEPAAPSTVARPAQPIQARNSSENSRQQLEPQSEPDQTSANCSLATSLEIHLSANQQIMTGTNFLSTFETGTDLPPAKPDAATISHQPSLETQPESEYTSKQLNQQTGPLHRLPGGEPSHDPEMSVDVQNPSLPVEPQRQPAEALKSITGQKRPAPANAPQENTLAELKAQRAALVASLAALSNIQDLIAKNDATDEACEASNSESTDAEITAAANMLVKNHIKLLHEYNEIKDVGQGLMGLIADQRGVRIVEVQDEFGLDPKD